MTDTQMLFMLVVQTKAMSLCADAGFSGAALIVACAPYHKAVEGVSDVAEIGRRAMQYAEWRFAATETHPKPEWMN